MHRKTVQECRSRRVLCSGGRGHGMAARDIVPRANASNFFPAKSYLESTVPRNFAANPCASSAVLNDTRASRAA